MSIPKISVVICVKDRSNLLRQALQSLVRQTFTDFECIIVNDYSNEDIEIVVKEFNDERFIVVKNPGKPGISSARNFGNKLARAKWIAVADSDDINLPIRLQRTVEAIETANDIDVIYTGGYSFKDGTYDFASLRLVQEYNRDSLYCSNYILHNSVAYTKEIILKHAYDEDLMYAEDYDLWLNLSDNHVKFHFINEALILYRLHENQTTLKKEKRYIQDQIVASIIRKHAPFRYDM